MPATRLSAEPVSSPLASAFSISRGSKTSAETIRVTLQSQNGTGRGECVPYARYGESLESVLAQIESVRTEMEQGINCEALLDALPAGAARCALDCALWDLEAKISGVPVWKRAGLPEPKPLATAVTISLDTSEAMAQAARQVKGQILKLKLGGAHDIEKLKAVRTARPDARLILDANEGFSEESFPDLAHSARKLGVVMIEQPFPVGQDEPLERTASPVSVCADESAHTSEGLEALARRYDAGEHKTRQNRRAHRSYPYAERSEKVWVRDYDRMYGCRITFNGSGFPSGWTSRSCRSRWSDLAQRRYRKRAEICRRSGPSANAGPLGIDSTRTQAWRAYERPPLRARTPRSWCSKLLPLALQSLLAGFEALSIHPQACFSDFPDRISSY